MDSVFRRHLRRVSAEGATVLLSSHILSEVEQLRARVTIIRASRAVEVGSRGKRAERLAAVVGILVLES